MPRSASAGVCRARRKASCGCTSRPFDELELELLLGAPTRSAINSGLNVSTNDSAIACRRRHRASLHDDGRSISSTRRPCLSVSATVPVLTGGELPDVHREVSPHEAHPSKGSPRRSGYGLAENRPDEADNTRDRQSAGLRLLDASSTSGPLLGVSGSHGIRTPHCGTAAQRVDRGRGGASRQLTQRPTPDPSGSGR